MNDETKRKINELKEKVNNPYLLVMNRVPLKEKEWFIKWSEEEFVGDRGMAFKWLCQGYMPPENTVISQRLDELESKIEALYDLINKKNEEELIKLGNGKTIRKR